jgi:hypothetical protein
MGQDGKNSSNFYALGESVAPSENDPIIDKGAGSFVPLSRRLIPNRVPSLIQERQASDEAPYTVAAM